jgi:hypothetical protein
VRSSTVRSTIGSSLMESEDWRISCRDCTYKYPRSCLNERGHF